MFFVDDNFCVDAYAETDYYNDIIPKNLKCADPTWILWSNHYQQIGVARRDTTLRP
jgi:hypothetical protein